ncbi:zeta toxin family protein [Candidatus Spongiihabitans sp.]|uniref:zeta toxin family protein n=1 Tax=Candidatus Spongiihabitans sp. TaxID=3101308 RepID=UPI003C6FA84A
MADISEKEISDKALQYAKENHKTIVAQITEGFHLETNPVSIFMAGSPGAGKTETSMRLLKNIDNMLRIDADELRNHFHDYKKSNSHLFQKAATKLVHEIHNSALKNRISFLLDGTFANENIARENIKRSLNKNRDVFILFVYQSPMTAWNFVQQREIVEGRRIRSEDFAKKFYASREVVNKIKAEFGNRVIVALLCKNIDGTNKFYKKSVERIDDHIPEKYSEEQILKKILDQ